MNQLTTPKTKTLHQMGKYIDLNKLLGHQKTFYLICSNRGFGKTYAVSRYVINQWFKKKKKFVYMRRYKGEMKMIGQFFEDMQALYPDHEFKVKGWNLYIDNQLVGLGVLLNRYQSYKGGVYKDYDTIIFDEFLREKVGSVGYLNNELDAFLNICDSVFRDRPNVKAFLLGNSVNEVNPYFLGFQLNRKPNSEYVFSENEGLKDHIVCYIRDVTDEAAEEKASRSNFQTLITYVDSYAKSASRNEFLDEEKVFIKKKSKEAHFHFAFKLDTGRILGVWYDKQRSELFISNRYEKTTKKLYAFSSELHDEQTILVKEYKKEYNVYMMIRAFHQSSLFFENAEIKMNCYNLFSKLNIF